MDKKLKIGVLASGRGTNLQAMIDGIQRGELSAEIAIVISDNRDAMALERARKANIPTVYVKPGKKSEFEREVINILEENNAELIVLAGFMRILSPNFVNHFPLKIINIHPSLLPSFPGLEAQRQALEYGVKITGCTVHFVNEMVDAGPIILQEAVPVYDDDTVESLSDRILEKEHKILVEAVRIFSENKLKVIGRRVFIDKTGSDKCL
ncbi:MAG TPA: phosphoribosylglycinamide formyltransferase [bacterium]|nr:phosphoribosylglycinamide formyltransferase [bacterium]